MSLIRPSLFVVHDREHDDTLQLLRNTADSHGVITLRSFTDTHPVFNDHNAGLGLEASMNADYLLIQNSLLGIGSETVKAAMMSTSLSGEIKTQYGTFDDSYRPRWLEKDEIYELMIS